MCQYNRWANQKLVEALAQKPANEEVMLKFSHIALAEEVWLDRLDGKPVAGRNIFETMPIEAIDALLTKCFSRWEIFINQCPDFNKALTFKRLDGTPMENTVGDILTHIFNHGTYHRAQIATLMRQQGLQPVITDYIAFARTWPSMQPS